MTIDSVAPRIVRTDTPDGPCARCKGAGARPNWARGRSGSCCVASCKQRSPAATLGWDLRSLQWLDHVGAQLLWNHWGHAWPARLS